MAYAEIDSFVLKMKNLLNAGIHSQLTIKSEVGKTFLTLTAEVKVPSSFQNSRQPGGARERRRERRAAARAATADSDEAASATVSGRETFADKVAGKGEAKLDSDEAASAIVSEREALANKAAGKAETKSTEEATFEKPEAAEQAPSRNVHIRQPNDEIENETISRDTSALTGEVCKAISIIPVRGVDVTDEDVKRIVKRKLEAKNVKVLEMFIQRSQNGTFTRCDASIESVNANIVEETNFEFGSCKTVPLYGIL